MYKPGSVDDAGCARLSISLGPGLLSGAPGTSLAVVLLHRAPWEALTLCPIVGLSVLGS